MAEVCVQCAKPLAAASPVGGRPARFCSSSCRKAAYRRRRSGVDEALPRLTSPSERRRGLLPRLFVEEVAR
jgi:hypothetical protein